MLIKTIWVNNAYRNFNYIVVCEETGDALVIDPLDHEQCLAVCKQEGYQIRQILNTHEHWDHIGGNSAIVESTGAKILAHHGADGTIEGLARGLKAGDSIRVGKTVELEVLDTPGHTMSHVCAIAHSDQTAIFSGDTLFNAGAGNCHNGGHPEALYQTFTEQLHTLDPSTRIYPGHDYLANNLQFTLDREPDNQSAQTVLDQALEMDPCDPIVTTIGMEQQINTFFRLDQQTIIDKLCQEDATFPTHPEAQDVFLKLRALRNNW